MGFVQPAPTIGAALVSPASAWPGQIPSIRVPLLDRFDRASICVTVGIVVNGFLPPGPSTRIEGVPVNPRLFASVSFLESSGSHLEFSERSLFHLSRSLTPAPFAIEVRNESVT